MPVIKPKVKAQREYVRQLNAMYERIEIDSRLQSFIEDGYFKATGEVRIDRQIWLEATDAEIRRARCVLEAIYACEETIVEKKVVFSSFE